jgi:hypothetical protein
MRMRLKMGPGVRLQRAEGKNRKLALAGAALLVPWAVLSAVLTIWRLTGDMGITAQFLIAQGPFSHWVAWGTITLLLAVTIHRLNRYGRA